MLDWARRRDSRDGSAVHLLQHPWHVLAVIQRVNKKIFTITRLFLHCASFSGDHVYISRGCKYYIDLPNGVRIPGSTNSDRMHEWTRDSHSTSLLKMNQHRGDRSEIASYDK